MSQFSHSRTATTSESDSTNSQADFAIVAADFAIAALAATVELATTAESSIFNTQFLFWFRSVTLSVLFRAGLMALSL